MNSTAPAAPSMWPVADLVELTLSAFAASPNTALIALVSLRSLAGVDVPCALMYSHVVGREAGVLHRALHRALRALAVRAPAP